MPAGGGSLMTAQNMPKEDTHDSGKLDAFQLNAGRSGVLGSPFHAPSFPKSAPLQPRDTFQKCGATSIGPVYGENQCGSPIGKVKACLRAQRAGRQEILMSSGLRRALIALTDDHARVAGSR